MTEEDVNWGVLSFFANQPHPAIRRVTVPDNVTSGMAEVLVEATVAHHLLSLAQIPLVPHAGGTGLDARMFLALRLIQRQQEVLDRIAGRHVREEMNHGLVGLYCVECGQKSPCETYLLAMGQLEENETEDL